MKRRTGTTTRRRALSEISSLLGLKENLRRLAARAPTLDIGAPAGPMVVPVEASMPLFDRAELRTLGLSFRIVAFFRDGPPPANRLELLRDLVAGLARVLGPDRAGDSTLTDEDEAELKAGRWRGREWGEDDPMGLPLILELHPERGLQLTVWMNY